jgi:hypothetical protein
MASLEETDAVEQRLVIRIPKEGGPVEIVPATDHPADDAGFLAALSCTAGKKGCRRGRAIG